MGKIHIPEDLKCKLDKVLAIKNDKEEDSTPVGPAPKWKVETPTTQPVLPVIKETINSIKKCNPLDSLGYFDWGKIVFFTSFIGGIGLTLGVKIGRIIFY